MFSRNQIWRAVQRVNTEENFLLGGVVGGGGVGGGGGIGSENKDEIDEEEGVSGGVGIGGGIKPKRSHSSDKILSLLSPSSSSSSLSSLTSSSSTTTTTRATTSTLKKENKQVRFSETCRVVLIPCLKEYRSLGLHLDMWWEEKDYRSFKISATQEITNFLSSFGGDVKSITRYLYQPDSVKMSLIGMDA